MATNTRLEKDRRGGLHYVEPGSRDVDSVWVHPRVGIQSSTSRFGPGSGDTIRERLVPFHFTTDNGQAGYDSSGDDEAGLQDLDPDASEGDDDHAGASTDGQSYSYLRRAPARIPHVARARINLTALSQRYNLYFAVYQDKIHVYRPQAGSEILPHVETVLCPGPSAAARLVGGYLDRDFPHMASHALVGDFGREEILLLAYDDGDVIGYYTHSIASYLERRNEWARQRRPGKRPEGATERACRANIAPKKPEPFFHDNVGKSAWGLAVHAKSRLIAVSSNLAEVTVFAFVLNAEHTRGPHGMAHDAATAATDATDVTRDRSTSPDQAAFEKTAASTPLTISGLRAAELERELRARDRNWRILLPLGDHGSNMPSISFSEDRCGFADKVVGVDINGTLWILDIWRIGARPLSMRSPMEPGSIDGMYAGWGVLVLPHSDFVKTNKMPAARVMQAPGGAKCASVAERLDLSSLNDLGLSSASANPVSEQDYHLFRQADSLEHLSAAAAERSDEEDDAGGSGSAIESPRASGRRGVEDAHGIRPLYTTPHGPGNIGFVPGIGQRRNIATFSRVAMHVEGMASKEGKLPSQASLSRGPACLSFSDDLRLRSFSSLIRPGMALDGYEAKTIDFGGGPVKSDLVICPSLGLTWTGPETPAQLVEMLLSPCRFSEVDAWDLDREFEQFCLEERGLAVDFESMACRFSILRTFKRSVQLVSLDPREMSCVLRNAVSPPETSGLSSSTAVAGPAGNLNPQASEPTHMSANSQPPPILDAPLLLPADVLPASPSMWHPWADQLWDMAPQFHRLSLLHAIPELGLIIVGGMHGRVSLLRLVHTKHPSGITRYGACIPIRSPRIEWMLPRRSEEKRKLRPGCCLLGIAVSRVPVPGASRYSLAKADRPFNQHRLDIKAAATPRRWRLILHYMDHTILQYHIEERIPEGTKGRHAAANGSGSRGGSGSSSGPGRERISVSPVF